MALPTSLVPWVGEDSNEVKDTIVGDGGAVASPPAAESRGSVTCAGHIGLGIERAPPEETFVPNVDDLPAPASTAAGTVATEGEDGLEEAATI